MGLRSAYQRHASVLRGFDTIVDVSGTVTTGLCTLSRGVHLSFGVPCRYRCRSRLTPVGRWPATHPTEQSDCAKKFTSIPAHSEADLLVTTRTPCCEAVTINAQQRKSNAPDYLQRYFT